MSSSCRGTIPLVLSLYLFLAAASVEALRLTPRVTTGDVWGGVNITEMVLQVAAAISSPTCNATSPCIELTTVEIPKCLKILGNPGCWCSGPDPIHYCAICMSSPTDNTTTPDQTQAAGAGHQNYHTGCNAYQAFLNGSSTASMTSSSTSSSSSSSPSTTPTFSQAAANSGTKSVNAGTIGGVVVGGVVGLALIVAAFFLLYRYMQNKHERVIESTQRASMFSSPPNDVKYTGGGLPVTGFTPPPITQQQNIPYDTRMLGLPPQV